MASPHASGGARPGRADLEAARNTTLPDLLGPDVRLLICGINPSLWAAATQAHFARPGNRFWPALHDAGLTGRLVDCSAGMRAEDRQHVLDRGLGITNLVRRATARADELDPAEFVAGRQRLAELVAELRPAVVAVAGVTAYRHAFAEPRAALGRQDRDLAGAQLWALPSPSGLNAHASRAGLAAAFAEAGRAAGLLPARPLP
ncbi:mismatch-specific DNA-glycosylase [Kocuria sp. CPCC 205292]|uniref:DNA glycosylase n=1 Tax=Kocuria rosea subsp. polaris TaxID=136273 RepID=A0A0W8IQR7_KOCRO|nr:mismatch-specific DNA-glycosylase [Kocuria polaris]KUG62238.1 DNA glycosylase [Kocuria polaris]